MLSVFLLPQLYQRIEAIWMVKLKKNVLKRETCKADWSVKLNQERIGVYNKSHTSEWENYERFANIRRILASSLTPKVLLNIARTTAPITVNLVTIIAFMGRASAVSTHLNAFSLFIYLMERNSLAARNASPILKNRWSRAKRTSVRISIVQAGWVALITNWDRLWTAQTLGVAAWITGVSGWIREIALRTGGFTGRRLRLEKVARITRLAYICGSASCAVIFTS